MQTYYFKETRILMSESSTFCDHRIAPNNAKQWRTLPKVFQRRKGVKWNIRLNHFNFVCSMLLEYRTIVAMRNIKIIKLSYWNNPISKTYYFNIIWSYRKYFNWSSPYTDWNDVLKERKIFRKTYGIQLGSGILGNCQLICYSISKSAWV